MSKTYLDCVEGEISEPKFIKLTCSETHAPIIFRLDSIVTIAPERDTPGTTSFVNVTGGAKYGVLEDTGCIAELLDDSIFG